MKYLLLPLIVALMLVSCGETTTKPKAVEIPKNWEYYSEPNKITGDSDYYAICQCPQKLEFQFPYQGGSTVSLYVGKKKGELECHLSLIHI